VIKHYWWIIITYVLMQLSAFAGVPMMYKYLLGTGLSKELAIYKAQAYWTIFSFSLALVIILILLKNVRQIELRDEAKASVKASTFWAIGGAFMALFDQSIAANIEINVFGIDPGSENTQIIMDLVKMTPLLILVTSIIGPILEEIIFRRILFRVIYKRTNFMIGALVSSILFALVHGEPEHILLYASMGFTFAYLYVKTNRILVPIFAHTMMNTFVVIIQFLYGEEIEKMTNQMEKIQIIIGGI